MLCNKCGNVLYDNQKFCTNCGQVTDQNSDVFTNYTHQATPLYQSPGVAPATTTSPNILFFFLGLGFTFFLLILTLVVFLFTKASLVGMIISLFLIFIFLVLHIIFSRKSILPLLAFSITPLILVSGIFGVSLFFRQNNIAPGRDSSSLVSKGVNTNDLGNIMNGQYFFDSGEYQFYANFDTSGAAHIYRTEKSSGYTSSIFNGFGWSFTVDDDWLYFSGNEGEQIDATYNLFRIKTDGSEFERLNNSYCFGLNFYDKYLYYIKADNHSSTSFSLCRSDLDGTNEQVLVQNANGNCAIFDDKLYYLGTDNYIYKSDPDGSNPEAVVFDSVEQFIIGNGKLLYTDNSGNIKSSKTDGSDILTIRQSQNTNIGRINSYKNNIFYVLYDEYDSTKYGWPYTLHIIKDDGTGDSQIYNSISDGFYINILNDKLYVLDYAYDQSTPGFPAIAKSMNFDGSDFTILYR